ncbi:TIGR03773 family transporter-associated surface protein [Schaalia canis]|uniref:ABC transporter-associated repeat protein n=1 Tax=Schaalia canis TaxID=100469 RepID=A0A3P1SGZ4_9ACTO|nr:TIGR03773 family transporter-associated surface protein [Schaalia canis]RRC96334.1 hypothetical protein EII11_01400 [Schaalia canis]
MLITRRRSKRAFTSVTTLLLAFALTAGGTPVSGSAYAATSEEEPLQVLDDIPVDLFHLSADAEGALTLQMRTRDSETPKFYDPAKAALKVPDVSEIDPNPQNPAHKVPEAVYDSAEGYHVRPTKKFKSELLTGSAMTWNLEGMLAQKYTNTSIKVTLVKAPADAQVFTFARNEAGDAVSLVEDSDKNAGTFRLPNDAKGVWLGVSNKKSVEAEWIFTKPGIYKLAVSAMGETDGGSFSRRTEKTYTIAVGDDTEVTADDLISDNDTAAAAPSTNGHGGGTTPPSGSNDTTPPQGHTHGPQQPGQTPPTAQNPGNPDGTNDGHADAPQGSISTQIDPVTQRAMLYRTHVDAAHINWDADKNRLAVGVIDGSTLRPAEDVVVRLGPDADTNGREVSRIKLPASNALSFLGKPGEIVWNAPAQYYRGWRPLWAGYGAGDMPAHIVPDSLELELVSVDGPGWMSVWRSGAGFVQEDLNSSNDDRRRVRMTAGAHGHFNWSFSEAGRYTTTWKAHARTTEGGVISSQNHDVIWLVGPDSAVGLPENTTQAAAIFTPAESFDVDPAPQDPGHFEAAPVGESAERPEKGTYTCVANGHHDIAARMSDSGKVQPFWKDTAVTGKTVERASGTIVVPVPDYASHTLNVDGPGAALKALAPQGSPVWTLPEQQDPKLAWIGVNTEAMPYSKLSGDAVQMSFESVEGPGRMVHWDADILNGARVLMNSSVEGDKIVLADPTHKHLATSFTSPGLYLAEYTIRANYGAQSGWVGSTDYDWLNVYYAVGNAEIAALCGDSIVIPPTANTPKEPDTQVPPTSPKPGEQPSRPNPPAGTDSPKDTGSPKDNGSPKDTDSPKNNDAPTGNGTPKDSDVPKDTTPDTRNTAPSACYPKGVTTVLDSGHTDLFTLMANTNGGLDLKVKEDVTAPGTIRDPHTVLIKVKESAQRDLPAGIPGSPRGYYLPQGGDKDLVWPGWDTQGIAAAGLAKASFDVSYTGPEGGRIHMFITKGFGGNALESRLTTGGYTLDPAGSTIVQDYPAHTHVNWVFSKPGRYTLTVTGNASREDGSHRISSAPQTYIIDVGTINCGGPRIELSSTTVQPGGSLELTASGLTPHEEVVFEIHSDPIVLPAVRADEKGVARTQWKVPADFPVGHHHALVQGHPELKIAFHVASHSTDKKDADSAQSGKQPNGPGGTGSSSGAGSNGPTSAPSGRTDSGSISGGSRGGARGGAGEVCIPTVITREAEPEEVKKLESASQGAAAGKATTTLTFNVGPGASGNARDGHFDLGPVIENNTVFARIKDDRQQPAVWVDPTSLTFAVGDEAALDAPEQLKFIASSGSKVWMIQQTQVKDVPWLGMNSQREEIVNRTTGEVTFTLESVDGPGKVAVFESGTLGSGVGKMVFNGAGSSYTLSANTHAHHNWLFTAPGTYTMTISMEVQSTSGELKGSSGASGGLTLTGEKGPNGRPMVSETVGRTKSGQPCSLAQTGAQTDMVAPYALLLVILGGVAVVAARRGTRLS